MASFVERQKTLFDVLKAAEDSNCPNRKFKTPSAISKSVTNSQHHIKALRSQTKPYRHKKSLFLRSEDSIVQCLGVRAMPDYHKNPHKWTYYSLEDVPDVTDQSNARAAAQCLEEIRSSKQNLKAISEDNESKIKDDKVVFKLPIRVQPSEELSNESDITYRNSKIILPEYVVGKSNSSKSKMSNKRDKKCSNSNKAELKLDHLLYDEES